MSATRSFRVALIYGSVMCRYLGRLLCLIFMAAIILQGPIDDEVEWVISLCMILFSDYRRIMGQQCCAATENAP